MLFANLFSGTFLRQSLLHSFSFARFQIVGVTLHFLNYVFGLNLALEPTQGVLQRFALLQSNFRQTHHPPTSKLYCTGLEFTTFALRSVGTNGRIPPFASLNILQMFLIQPEIVTEFMNHRETNLLADFGLAGADCLNVFLVKNDVIWSG